MTEPFRVRRENGIVWIDRQADEAFRKALLDGVPPVLRAQMNEALSSRVSGGDAQAKSIEYFGKEFVEVVREISDLLFELNKYLSNARALPGLFDWLDATGLGNDARMIKVFKAWSEMKVSSHA